MKVYLRAVVLLAFAAAGLVFLRSNVQGQQSAGAIVAIDEAVGVMPSGVKAAGGGSGQTRSAANQSKSAAGGSGKSKGAKSTTKRASAVSKPVHSVDTSKFNGPVMGDKYSFLNFEVISAAKPTHTNVAKQAGAKGLVQVEVLVSENGNVLSAKARTGNKLLWDEAERAAMASKFNKPSVNGQPARALGFLVYRFGPPSEDDD